MNNQDAFTRFAIIGVVLCVMPFLIIVQLLRVQFDATLSKDILEAAQPYVDEPRYLVPARGPLYDRWGNLLAGNKMVFEIGVELQFMKDPHTIAQTLALMTDAKYADMYQGMVAPTNPDQRYVRLWDYVEPETAYKLQALKKQLNDAYDAGDDPKAPNLKGLVFTEHLARVYPEKSLASNVLGFVNREDTGHYGVEERFNDLLTGKVRMVNVPRDPVKAIDLPDAGEGSGLILAVDRELQRSMEQLIDDAVAETGSVSGVLLISNPKTGEVMAMATTPRLDLNQYWDYAEVFPAGWPFNMAVSQAYEPGSVYKVLTMASALDMGAVKPETVFVDTGSIEQGGITIFNWNMGAWGPQDMTGCMQHSLNVCLTWIAKQMGPNDMYRYFQGFGIGRLTGVDLAQEAQGHLKMPGDSDWYDSDLGTNSFGQGVSATPVQMITAISAVANNGAMMAPQVVRSVVKDGYQYDIEHRTLGMPIRPETARTLTDMLAVSLEQEASDALVTGYRVAGKTGTAEIPTPQGYTSNQTNASFVGWGPADDPQFIVYVWLQKPSSSPWGSVVAAPVFRQAVEKLVLYLNLPPDAIRLKGTTQ